MCHCHAFRTVRDQISGDKGILHANMSHGNPVTYRDGRKYHRRTACHGHPHLHRLHDLIQVHMPRNDLIIGTDNTDQRALPLFLCITKCIKQASVRRLLYPFFN